MLMDYKKIVAGIISAILLVSCSTYKQVPSYSDEMLILRRDFPELYHLYLNGDIQVYGIYYKIDEDAVFHYRVSYRYTH